MPGHVDVQSADELRNNVLGTTVDHVIRNLTGEIAAVAGGEGSRARRSSLRRQLRGGQQAVLRERLERWPADRAADQSEKIAEFLAFTDLSARPRDRQAVARQQVGYGGTSPSMGDGGLSSRNMPILVALAEAMADPQYGVEHSGNTPGAETLIVLNGPLIKQLGFNYEQGAAAMASRPTPRSAASGVSYLRNVAGFLAAPERQGTFGNTWRVVLAENEDSLAKMKLPTVFADICADGDSAVIPRFIGGNVIVSVSLGTARRRCALSRQRAGDPHELGALVFTRSAWQREPIARCWCS